MLFIEVMFEWKDSDQLLNMTLDSTSSVHPSELSRVEINQVDLITINSISPMFFCVHDYWTVIISDNVSFGIFVLH